MSAIENLTALADKVNTLRLDRIVHGLDTETIDKQLTGILAAIADEAGTTTVEQLIEQLRNDERVAREFSNCSAECRHCPDDADDLDDLVLTADDFDFAS